jgi:hypothetical protein
VLPRLQQHALQQHPVRGLHVRALGDRDSGGPESLGKLVSDSLEFSEAEQSRLASSLGRLIKPTHRIGGYKRLRQLTLEALDLDPQGATRGTVIYFGDRRRWSGDALL